MARLAIVFLLLAAAAHAQDPLAEANKAIAAADWSRALALARPLAEKGNPEAQAILGRIHRGWADKEQAKLEIALGWYLKAAKQGHTDAQRQAAAILRTLERHAEAIAWLRKIGDAASMRQIGEAHRLGRGVSRDASRAADWYRQAAEKGDIEAQRVLGTMYRDGEGVPQDTAKAEDWLAKAKAQGDNHAGQLLETLAPRAGAKAEYESGVRALAEGRNTEALALLERAAADRSRDANLALARLYLDGKAVPFDYPKAVNFSAAAIRGGRAGDVVPLFWRAMEISRSRVAAGILLRLPAASQSDADTILARLNTLADSEDAVALAVLGLLHEEAAQTLRSKKNDTSHFAPLSLLYLWAAADRGEPHARAALFEAFRQGWGTRKDDATAGRYLRAAAENGESWAELEWGAALLQGLMGATRNQKAAIPFFERAADRGEKLALVLLGQCYLAGMGVEKDEAKALAIVKKAAATNYPAAVHFLGYMTTKGLGIEKDEIAGWALIGRAAQLGWAGSRQNIRTRAEQGVVHAVFWWGVLRVEDDKDKGLALIRQAAEKGYEPAISWLAEHAK